MTNDVEAQNVTIAVVEDIPVLRETLRDAINAEAGMTVVAEFDSVAETLAWLETNRPDVLLVDLGLPDGSGIQIIKACVGLHPSCDILVITIFGDEANVLASVDAGAKGYVLKDATDLKVVRFINDLRQGGSPMSPIVARKVLNRFQQQSIAHQAQPAKTEVPSAAIALTAKESEALDLIARGYAYNEIASLMQMSIHTVRTHVRHVYAKLSVHNRSEAVFEAHKAGLLHGGLLTKDTSPTYPR